MTLLAYHVTTRRKLDRCRATGSILPPVRFWPNEMTARAWMQRTGRDVLVIFERPEPSYPLPDHRPAMWTPVTVRIENVEIVTND